MKISKYIKRLLFKEWLPVIAVFSVVSVLVAVISVASYNFYDGYGFSLSTFTWSAALFAIVMPFFVFSYRFSKIGGDTYYQLPFSPKQFKNIRVITGLIAVMAVLIIAFLIGFIAFTIAYSIAPATRSYTTYVFDDTSGANASTYSQAKVVLYSSYMLLGLAVSLILIPGLYFISCTTVGLNTKLPSALVYTVIIQLVLSLGVLCINSYFEQFFSGEVRDSFYTVSLYSLRFSPGLIGTNMLIEEFSYGSGFFANPESSNLFDTIAIDIEREDYTSLITVISLVTLNLAVMGGAGFYTFYSGEPSGEYNGTSGTRNKYLNFLVYLLPFFVAFPLGNLAMSNIFIYCLLFVLFHAGLYVLVSIYLGTFKIGHVHALCIVGSGLFFIFLAVMNFIIQFNLWAAGY